MGAKNYKSMNIFTRLIAQKKQEAAPAPV